MAHGERGCLRIDGWPSASSVWRVMCVCACPCACSMLHDVIFISYAVPLS